MNLAYFSTKRAFSKQRSNFMPDISKKMPKSLGRNALGYISPDYIHINACGNLHIYHDSNPYRPNGRYDYLIIYICEGNCYLTINDKEYIAYPGDVVLYRPMEPQDYRFYKKEHPHNYWVHFSGVGCEDIFKECNLENDNIIKLTHTHEIEYHLSKLCSYYHLGGQNTEVICNGLLMATLGLINQYNVKNKKHLAQKTNSKAEELVSMAISQFKMNDVLFMSVADCAKFCNISTSHFTRIFKEQTGVSPQKFISNIRIERAQQLLLFTDKEISTISEDVGYNDQNYFSRLFKKNVNMTPREYRKKYKK